MLPDLDITINTGLFEFSVAYPLQPLKDAWDELVEHNEVRRAAREGEPDEPLLRVRVLCPDCKSPAMFLSRLPSGERECRRCGCRFGPEV
jgi:hypothetical protein